VAIDEKPIIEKVLAGDSQAFRPLVDENSRLVFTAVVKIVRDREVAQDIAQDVFLQAYRSLAKFRGESAFSTWLTRIAVNKALDYCRRRKARPQVEELPDFLPGEDGQNPETEVLKREEIWRMREEIKLLPEIYRNVLYKFYFRQLSYTEIAGQEDVSVKTVESRLYRARSKLRESMLGGEGENVSAP